MVKIKKSEARIMVFVEQADIKLRYLRMISAKLNMDYTYLIGIISRMIEKDWLVKQKVRGKTFLGLTDESPIREAKILLSGGQ